MAGKIPPIAMVVLESNNIDSSSPGQNISHYCPDKPVFILNIVNIDLKYNDSSLKEELSEKTGRL